MHAYVKSDNHEIIANLPTVSVDESGVYIIPINLPDDVWENIQNANVKYYKFYALNDTDLGDDQMKSGFINGLLSV